MKRILIMAGGTGGHIFPALAVADIMQENNIEVHWLGARGGLEEHLIPARFSISYIPVKAFRGKSLFARCLMPWRLLRATIQALKIIRRLRPNVILGMGGYVTVPGGIAAWISRTPLIIHEQNSVAGLSNRLLAKLAKTVLQAFPNAFQGSLEAQTTGNPVRHELMTIPDPEVRFTSRQGPLRILILGGSQGARAVNQNVLAALLDYPHKNEITVWHQTGQLDYEQVKQQYTSIPITVKLSPFIDNMVEAYQWADIVVCRAGALTVSEIATVGVSAIFIPYPFAVDNHQLHNSRYLEQAGAAIVIVQKDLTKERLIDLFRQFSSNRTRLLTMAQCARKLAQPQAGERVMLECNKLMTTKGFENDIRK